VIAHRIEHLELVAADLTLNPDPKPGCGVLPGAENAGLHLKAILQKIDHVEAGGADGQASQRGKAGIAQEFASHVGSGVKRRRVTINSDAHEIAGALRTSQ
jgi:hypothetical protein